MKTFARGESVLVRRGASAPLEPAEYVKACPEWRGYHVVLLPVGAERRIDSMSGEECGADNPRSYLTRKLTVPSRRICPTVKEPHV